MIKSHSLCWFSLILSCCSVIIQAQWKQTNGPFGGHVFSLAVKGPEIFAGTGNGIFTSVNNGTTWIQRSDDLTHQSISSIIFLGSDIFTAAGWAGVFVSSDNGVNWAPAGSGMPFPTLVQTLGVNGTTLFAGTYGGGIFRSTDNGQNWTPANNGLTNLDMTVMSIVTSGSYLFAATWGDGVYMSTDNGENWTPVNNGLTNSNVTSLAVIDTTLFAGTHGDGVFHSTDNGSNWTPVNNGLFSNEIQCLGVKGNDLFAGTCGYSRIYYSADMAESWTEISADLMNMDVFSFTVKESVLYAGTYGGGVYYTSDNGTNWTQSNTGMIDCDISSLATSGENILAGTSYNGFFYSYDNGTSWQQTTGSLAGAVTSNFVESGSYIFAGSLYSIYRSTDHGITWENFPSNGSLASGITCLASDGTNLFAGTYWNGVYLSFDNGENWTPANTGMEDERVTSMVIKDDTLFAGIHGGGVMRSANNEVGWSPVNNGITDYYIRSLVISGENLIAGAERGIFLSDDNGDSWTLVDSLSQYPRVLSFVANDSLLFAGTCYSGIFVSSDHGLNWSSFNANLSNKGVYSLVLHGTDLLAGVDFEGVWRTSLCSTDSEYDTANIIENGDFESCSLSPWWLWVNTGAGVQASMSQIEGRCTVSDITYIDNPEVGQVWINQSFMPSQSVRLEKNQLYELSFEAQAKTEGHTCEVFYGGEDIVRTFDFTPGTTLTSFSFEFMMDTICPAIQLAFWPALETGAFTIDNVQLKKSSGLLLPDIASATTEVKVFPNPVSECLSVVTKPGAVIQLSTILGNVVENRVNSDGTLQFDLSDLLPGIYLVQVCDDNKWVTQKVIKL
jgi:photosystem II stability/assembly factor-like uncharacterized protein